MVHIGNPMNFATLDGPETPVMAQMPMPVAAYGIVAAVAFLVLAAVVVRMLRAPHPAEQTENLETLAWAPLDVRLAAAAPSGLDDRLEILEDRFLRGEMSEATYLDQRRRAESEPA